MGMTDSQYKGMLMDEKESWMEMLKALEPLEGPDAEKAKAWARQQINKIDEKMKL